MKDDLFNLIRVIFANIASWTATTVAAFTLQDVTVVVSIFSGMGSIAVSAASILWIRKQMKGHKNGSR